MFSKSILSAALALAPAAFAAPAPQAAYFSAPASASDAPVPAPTVRSSQVTGITSHGPYSGTPTTVGALTTVVLAASIPALPPNPTATTYPSDGQLHDPEPAPYTPAGGLGTNGTEPIYNVKSDFDYESLAVALYQEWIELDLFHDGLAKFSVAEFEAAGLTADDRSMIEFMADQEVGHSTLLSNILGAEAPVQCTYNYPYTTVREFIDFCQKITRFGESGVYGFINHLDSREAAQLLLQSISTEARQQFIFRQWDGIGNPMPVWFEAGIPQSWAWTLLAPYISSCPANQTRLAWQNFPALTVLNQPNPARINANRTTFGETVGNSSSAPLNETAVPTADTCFNSTIEGADCSPAISSNRSIPLSFAGRQVFFQWETPGKAVGPNNSYVTSTAAGAPAFVAWVSQLNLTYSDLITTGPNQGYTFQPNTSTYAGDPAINGTMFVALTDSNITLTPFNLSMINPFVAAGPALYQAG
ncbi:hypothetical protein MMC09_000192 [Bachmanniomyces sp. S44760]|nr:hypothetical protein [Bachmanniomyces sp. S44760]